jgi:hypothetical protein
MSAYLLVKSKTDLDILQFEEYYYRDRNALLLLAVLVLKNESRFHRRVLLLKAQSLVQSFEKDTEFFVNVYI